MGIPNKAIKCSISDIGDIKEGAKNVAAKANNGNSH